MQRRVIEDEARRVMREQRRIREFQLEFAPLVGAGNAVAGTSCATGSPS